MARLPDPLRLFRTASGEAALALAQAQARSPLVAGVEGVQLVKSAGHAVAFRGLFGGEAVLLKLILGDGAGRQAARQADALAEAAPRMGAGPFRTPRLVFAAPEACAFAAAFVEGVRLDTALAAADLAGRDRLMRAAGAWLAAYCAERRAAAFQARYWLRLRRGDLARLGTGPQGGLAAALAARLEALAPAVQGHPVTQGKSHGDFGPQNLIEGQGALWGIDLEGSAFLPVLKDAVRFLLTAALDAPRPGAGPGIAAADAAALLSAPGLPRGEGALLPFLEGAELADRLARLRPDTPRGRRLAAAARRYAAGEATIWPA
jgi:hypothetical protein